jgi:hypothetical protein
MEPCLENLDWPKVKFEQVGCFTRWSVEPAMKGAPCWNRGIEFSQHLAEKKAGNYVRLLLGEELPTLQELLA